MRVLITGGAGFIGHQLVETLLWEGEHQVTILDRLDHSGNLNRLTDIGAHGKVKFLFHDLRSRFNDQLLTQVGEQDYIVHMAAATHVDRSIDDPMDFVQNNVVATCNMLDMARAVGCGKFLMFSTDEVFGPAPNATLYREDDRYRSGNPYAATKAGAEELAIAYHNTYGLPVMVTHTMNAIGPRQDAEKFVPMTIAKVSHGETVTIHSDPTKTRPGSRFYIHIADIADAVMFLWKHGSAGEKYNVVGQREIDNLELARMIATHVGKPLRYKLVDFHSARPGHDLRYGLDGSKMAALGWTPARDIELAIEQTVGWYLKHPNWWRPSKEVVLERGY